MKKQEILIEEARRFRGNAREGDVERREAYEVIGKQLEKGIKIPVIKIYDTFVCSKCIYLISEGFLYCPYCGQALEWEERNEP